MTLPRTLLIVAMCLAVVLAAPAACLAETCVETTDSCCCANEAHEGPQAVVKPLAAVPAVDSAPLAAVFDLVVTSRPVVAPEATFSADLPLRI